MSILPPLTTRPRPCLLVILDGWGCRETADDNAITSAKTPNWNHFASQFPKGTLSASAFDVGLPEGQMGNSEVGHMNIGSGRVVLQDLPRIDKAISEGSIPSMAAMQDFIAKVKAGSNVCHLMGLLSPGGVHSHQSHFAAMAVLLAKAGITVKIHAFLDGRDTPPKSALEYVAEFKKAISAQSSHIEFSTVSGRYYAMDRDKRWERVEQAYRALKDAKGSTAPTIESAIETSYSLSKSDEFLAPTVLDSYSGMIDGDGIFMINFRADRAREILSALLAPNFKDFVRNETFKPSAALGMVEYSEDLNSYLTTLFPPETITQTLGEVVAAAGLKQLRIAETEKYAHVTFFLNAGREDKYNGEDRVLIPSPKVATYDLKPEMSAYEVTEALEQAIADEKYDLIVVNYANPDMVGHTGNMKAAIKAVEVVDDCLGRLGKAIAAKNSVMLITADHGNIEQMADHHTHQAHTAHTLNLVPFVVVYGPWEGQKIALPTGKLCDVAPTILHLMRIQKPTAMTGASRLKNFLNLTSERT